MKPQLHPRARYLERASLARGWTAETTPAAPEPGGEAAELHKQLSRPCLAVQPMPTHHSSSGLSPGWRQKEHSESPLRSQEKRGTPGKAHGLRPAGPGLLTPSPQLCEPRGQGLSTALYLGTLPTRGGGGCYKGIIRCPSAQRIASALATADSIVMPSWTVGLELPTKSSRM